MVSPLLGATKKVRQKRIPGPYKGVRMRAWGKWVLEIRLPNSKTRIWLGSYDAPEKAVRAYDAALYCIRGVQGQFNFPTEGRPEIPTGSVGSLSNKDIKEIAARFATPDCLVPVAMPCPFTSSISSLTAPVDFQYIPSLVFPSEQESAWNIDDESFDLVDLQALTNPSPVSLQFDDLALEIDWMRLSSSGFDSQICNLKFCCFSLQSCTC
ncbi:AP2/ERF domain [Dillenia turbinata]|uniref:AP2/ERF domain n=1 Tax=Dillenia turbinata TaxID=194707 RepID=A0AAN8ZPD6_9MAGN